MLFAVSFAATVFAADSASTAAYATVKPVIDGEIDAIWEHTAAQTMDDDYDLTGCYIKLLWDEDGLYLLAAVGDDSLTENDPDARNSVDFWVSELNTQADDYSSSKGDWHFCMSSTGVEVYYTGNRDVYDVAERAVKITDNGYIVELFVPYLSEVKAAEGTVIGYTVSVNDDFDDDGVRDGYIFWQTSVSDSAYWEKTLALCDVELVAGLSADLFADAAAPIEEAPAEETAAPVEEAPAPVEETPAPAPVATAPQTFDAIGLTVIAVVASLGMAVISKKK